MRIIRIHSHLRLGVLMALINRGFFFTQVRRMLFSNILQQPQVDGMNAILDAWEAKYADRRRPVARLRPCDDLS